MLLVLPGASPFLPLRKTISMSAARTKAAKTASRVDVAVVGGGPGGLATAAAVRSAFGKHVGVKVRQHHQTSTEAKAGIVRNINCLAGQIAGSPT